MAHIHEEPNGHDCTVSAFIVLEVDGENKVLFHRHRRIGSWFQPGGHVEISENPWQAIAHELQEETGFELEDLYVLQASEPLLELREIAHPVPILYRSHRYTNSEPAHYHTDATYGFKAKYAPRKLPAEGESQELEWFSKEELLSLPNTEIHPDVRDIAIALLAKLDEFKLLEASSYSIDYPEDLPFRP